LLVVLYAKTSEMRVISSPEVLAAAECELSVQLSSSHNRHGQPHTGAMRRVTLRFAAAAVYCE
jgi:hypothetical protein